MRTPDPARLLQFYRTSSAALNLGLTAGKVVVPTCARSRFLLENYRRQTQEGPEPLSEIQDLLLVAGAGFEPATSGL